MIEYIHFFPNNKKVKIKPGSTILDTAIKNRVFIIHKCGGKGSCLTCKIEVDSEQGISKPSDIEIRKIGESSIKNGIRLSCQTRVFSSCTVRIPEDPLKRAIRKQLEENDD